VKNDHVDPLFQQILNMILPAALQTPKGTAKLAADLDIVGEADALASEVWPKTGAELADKAVRDELAMRLDAEAAEHEEAERFCEFTGPMDTRRTGVQWWETSGAGGAQ